MNTKTVVLLLLVTLILSATMTILKTLPPPPLTADASYTEFSATRALEHIRIIAREPHPAGSPANAAVREYILTTLQHYGLETVTQSSGNLVNVMGRMAGTASSDAVLLTAHLDSVAESTGASDDGTGVAVLLETLRALSVRAPLRNAVIFLFTDDEESGVVGARAFITAHPWASQVKVVIGFDAGGLNGPGVLSATSANNGWLIQQLARADRTISGSSAINALASSSTDFGLAFKPKGVSGYEFDIYWDRRIHTPEDNLAHVNTSSLQHQGEHALALANYLGNLEHLFDPKTPEAIYFNILHRFTVVYPSSWAVPLALAVTLIFALVLLFGRKEKVLTWRGMGVGALIGLVGILIAPLPSFLVGRYYPNIPLRYSGFTIDTPAEVSIAMLLALGLIITWYYLALRIQRTSLPDLAMGALLPLLVGMLGTAIALPALSFMFTWPLLLSALACANWFFWNPRSADSPMAVLFFLIAGTADIIILLPTLLLGMFDQPTLTLLLLGVLCGFLFPQIQLILGRGKAN